MAGEAQCGMSERLCTAFRARSEKGTPTESRHPHATLPIARPPFSLATHLSETLELAYYPANVGGRPNRTLLSSRIAQTGTRP